MSENEETEGPEHELAPRSWASDREKRIRRLLGLSAEPPNITGMLYVPVVGHPGIGGRLGHLPEDERTREAERYHAEDFRARLAVTLADLSPRTRSLCRRLRYVPTRLRADRALASARTLRYTSHYIHPHDEQEVDGYFDLGQDLSYGLEICTASVLREIAKYEWKQGEVVHSRNATVLGDYRPWVVVPGKRLDDQIIKDAISRWYQDIFRYRHRHWSEREGKLPEIIVSLHWEKERPQPSTR